MGLVGVFITALITALAGQLAGGWFSSTPAAPTVAQTAVRLMRVFDQSGKLLPPYHAAETLNGGSCINSYESSDPDALRCFSGNNVADPCWSGSPSEVACPGTPWTTGILLIQNPRIDATPRPAVGPTPWALEIINPADPGQVLDCSYRGGTGGTVAGMRINWGCFRQGQFNQVGSVGYGIGNPQVNTDKPWTIFYSPANSSQAVQATIITVWR